MTLDKLLIEFYKENGISEIEIIHPFSFVNIKSLAKIKSPLDSIIENQKTDNEQITKIKA